jgi:hypothetical protein
MGRTATIGGGKKHLSHPWHFRKENFLFSLSGSFFIIEKYHDINSSEKNRNKNDFVTEKNAGCNLIIKAWQRWSKK